MVSYPQTYETFCINWDFSLTNKIPVDKFLLSITLLWLCLCVLNERLFWR